MMPDQYGCVINSIKSRAYDIAVHPYGCRVIQRLLENCSHQTMVPIIKEIMHRVTVLIKD